MTMTVKAPTAKPRTFHVEVSAPAATRRYFANTRIVESASGIVSDVRRGRTDGVTAAER